jgi:hypothetical protein
MKQMQRMIMQMTLQSWFELMVFIVKPLLGCPLTMIGALETVSLELGSSCNQSQGEVVGRQSGTDKELGEDIGCYNLGIFERCEAWGKIQKLGTPTIFTCCTQAHKLLLVAKLLGRKFVVEK